MIPLPTPPPHTRVHFPKGPSCACLALGLDSMRRIVRKSDLCLGGGWAKPVTKSTTLRWAPYVIEISVVLASRTPQKLFAAMGPPQLVRAPRPRGMSSPYPRPGTGGPRSRCLRMFKCSRRTYRQKPRAPAATNLATVTTNISDTNNTTTSVWILSPQGQWGSVGWGICDSRWGFEKSQYSPVLLMCS